MKQLKEFQKKGRANSIAGLMRYSESLRQQRIAATKISTQKGKDDLGSLSDRDIYCIGLGLYWGEGYKQGSQEFGFTNNDPQMITFYMKWLHVVFGVQTEDVILRVSINQLHVDRISEVETFWARHISVSQSQFTKPSFVHAVSKKYIKIKLLIWARLELKYEEAQ